MKFYDKKLNFVENLKSTDERVSMLLYGVIGNDYYDRNGDPMVNGYEFASEMFYLSNCGFGIDVRINSPGGSIQPGFAVFDAIQQTKANTIAAGMAASMAGAILQAGAVRQMTDFASIMIHGIGGTDDDQLKSMLTAQLSSILAKKSKLSEEQIKEIMNSGKDHWFALKGVQENRHAFNLGLVDGVIETEERFSPNILENSFSPSKLLLAYNKILIPEEMETNFDQITKALKISTGSNEAAILEAINNALTERDRVSSENTKLKSDLESFKNERADKLVDLAKAKGYPEDATASLLDFAKSNYEGAEKMINSFSTAAAPVEPPTTPVAQVIPIVTAPPAANGLKKYSEYMATAQGEKEFYNLSPENQNAVLDAVTL